MKSMLRKALLAMPGFERTCRWLTRDHVRGLMFHRFCAEQSSDPRFISAVELEDYTKYIIEHHDVWSPDAHLAALVAPRTAPRGKCPVVVTVDDGYLDYYEVAYPVFQKYEIPAMLFVTTGFIDGDTWFWWDQLSYILRAAADIKLELNINGTVVPLDLQSEDGRQSAWHAVADRCRFISETEKNRTIEALSASLCVDLPTIPPDEYAPVSWDQIRIMAQNNCLFGAHTVTHPILSRVDQPVAEWEICTSGQKLAAELDRPVSWFCYPQGGPADYTPEVRKTVARYYDGCYVAYQSMDDCRDPFAMPRYCVNKDWETFRWIMCGAEYLVLSMKKRFGLGTGVGAGYWEGSQDGGV